MSNNIKEKDKNSIIVLTTRLQIILFLNFMFDLNELCE